MRIYTFIFIVFGLIACENQKSKENAIETKKEIQQITTTSLIILGTIQDAGSPHIGCKKDCCKNLFLTNDKSREVVSLGIIDPINKETYLFEATPDLPSQMKRLKNYCSFSDKETPDGIFLTHAHIGHYSGLIYLGKEGMNADSVSVFAMPRMKKFLEDNGPWSQLVNKKNINIIELEDSMDLMRVNTYYELSQNISVDVLKVPHRDEFSETVGYIIKGPSKKVLFIPDIDKWSKWEKNIVDEIAKVDYAFIDGTFYDGQELSNRNMNEIPHPFIVESMELFKNLSSKEKSKIHFIHFNHTNPVLDSNSVQAKTVLKNGFKLAKMNQVIEL